MVCFARSYHRRQDICLRATTFFVAGIDWTVARATGALDTIPWRGIAGSDILRTQRGQGS